MKRIAVSSVQLFVPQGLVSQRDWSHLHTRFDALKIGSGSWVPNSVNQQSPHSLKVQLLSYSSKVQGDVVFSHCAECYQCKSASRAGAAELPCKPYYQAQFRAVLV